MVLKCQVKDHEDSSLQWSNPAQQTLYFGEKRGRAVSLCGNCGLGRGVTASREMISVAQRLRRVKIWLSEGTTSHGLPSCFQRNLVITALTRAIHGLMGSLVDFTPKEQEKTA